MNRRTTVLSVLAAVLVALMFAVYLFALRPKDDDDPAAAATNHEQYDDADWFGSVDEAAAEDGEALPLWHDRGEAPTGRPGTSTMGTMDRMGRMRGRWRGDGGADGPGRDARRAARRTRFLSRIEITAVGSEPPATTSEDVFESFREVRPLVRDCLRDGGGGRESWRTMRAQDRTIAFDLDSDGAVVGESIRIEPAPPEPLAGCLATGLEVLTTTPPGEEGAWVAIDFPARRRRDAGP